MDVRSLNWRLRKVEVRDGSEGRNMANKYHCKCAITLAQLQGYDVESPSERQPLKSTLLASFPLAQWSRGKILALGATECK